MCGKRDTCGMGMLASIQHDSGSRDMETGLFSARQQHDRLIRQTRQ